MKINYNQCLGKNDNNTLYLLLLVVIIKICSLQNVFKILLHIYLTNVTVYDFDNSSILEEYFDNKNISFGELKGLLVNHVCYQKSIEK